MTAAGRRQRWKRGAVLRIRLDGGSFAYAQMLDAPEYAFFDLRDAGGADANHAASRPVAFRLWVARQTERWKLSLAMAMADGSGDSMSIIVWASWCICSRSCVVRRSDAIRAAVASRAIRVS